MSTSTSPQTQTTGPRGKVVAASIALIGTVGLALLIGVRVKEALAARAALGEQMASSTQATVKTEKVVRGTPSTWKAVVPVTGTLGPIQMADVGFKTGGRLARIAVKEGDVVHAGHMLGSLDVSEATAQLAAARAGVRSAEIGLALAEDGLKRVAALFATNSTSEADHHMATQKVELAKADLERVRAQAELAAMMVGNGSLSAPFSGLVTRVPSGIGRIVGPGEPLFHIEDTSTLKLSASVSETDAHLVDVNQEILVEGLVSTTGKVRAVLRSLDPATRRVPLIAEIANDGDSPLISGAFVRASIRGGDEVKTLSLPATALRPGSQDEVIVVRTGKAHVVKVQFASGDGGTLLVREGLAPTDDVLVAPKPEIKDGDAVSTTAG